MTEVNYTEEMVARLKEEEFFNLEIATAVGAEIGRSAKSVTAKAKSLGIEYRAKDRKEVVGVIAKKVTVAAIEAMLGVTLVSANKMTKVDLVKVENALREAGLEVETEVTE